MFVNMVIRPPRSDYNEQALPKEITAGDKKFKVESFEAYN